MTSPFCCGASVGQLVAAGMTEHMGVRLYAQIGRDGRPLDPFALRSAARPLPWSGVGGSEPRRWGGNAGRATGSFANKGVPTKWHAPLVHALASTPNLNSPKK